MIFRCFIYTKTSYSPQCTCWWPEVDFTKPISTATQLHLGEYSLTIFFHTCTTVRIWLKSWPAWRAVGYSAFQSFFTVIISPAMPFIHTTFKIFFRFTAVKMRSVQHSVTTIWIKFMVSLFSCLSKKWPQKDFDRITFDVYDINI